MLKWMQYSMQPEVQAEVGDLLRRRGQRTDVVRPHRGTLGKGGEELVDTVEYASAATRSS